jgi:hypothetical protein
MNGKYTCKTTNISLSEIRNDKEEEDSCSPHNFNPQVYLRGLSPDAGDEELKTPVQVMQAVDRDNVEVAVMANGDDTERDLESQEAVGPGERLVVKKCNLFLQDSDVRWDGLMYPTIARLIRKYHRSLELKSCRSDSKSCGLSNGDVQTEAITWERVAHESTQEAGVTADFVTAPTLSPLLDQARIFKNRLSRHPPSQNGESYTRACHEHLREKRRYLREKKILSLQAKCRYLQEKERLSLQANPGSKTNTPAEALEEIKMCVDTDPSSDSESSQVRCMTVCHV